MLRICDKAIDIIDSNLQSNGRSVAFGLAFSIASVIVGFTGATKPFITSAKESEVRSVARCKPAGQATASKRCLLGAPVSGCLHPGINSFRDPIRAHVDEIVQRHFGTQDFELNPATEFS